MYLGKKKIFIILFFFILLVEFFFIIPLEYHHIFKLKLSLNNETGVFEALNCIDFNHLNFNTLLSLRDRNWENGLYNFPNFYWGKKKEVFIICCSGNENRWFSTFGPNSKEKEEQVETWRSISCIFGGGSLVGCLRQKGNGKKRREKKKNS